MKRAEDGLHYEGIGKGSVNIEHLPVLFDELGAFGNPTGDSRRSCVQANHRELISVIYSFDGLAALMPWAEKLAALLKETCAVQTVTIEWIE